MMEKTYGKRGFVTIATGHQRYYRLAQNLLLSYHQFATELYPVAIIADRENEITAQFDHVIVISDASNSYNDKLKLFRELPYEETIFIDADSLAYGDWMRGGVYSRARATFPCSGMHGAI